MNNLPFGVLTCEPGKPKPVNYYGCVRCQAQHFEDTDASLYQQHLMWQSKHGVQQFAETMAERRTRYGIGEILRHMGEG